MAVKEFDARVRLKRDTSANWTANDPVILHGEIIIVDTADGKTRTKTGDGVKTYKQLPFDDEAVYNAISQKSDASVSVSATLTATGWTDRQQTLLIPSIKANQNGIASVAQSVSTEQYEAACDAGIYIYEQGEGTITFMISGKVPTIDIPISIILLG